MRRGFVRCLMGAGVVALTLFVGSAARSQPADTSAPTAPSAPLPPPDAAAAAAAALSTASTAPEAIPVAPPAQPVPPPDDPVRQLPAAAVIAPIGQSSIKVCDPKAIQNGVVSD